MAKKVKRNIEVLLVGAEITSLPERKLLKTRNLVCVDMIWPRAGVARKAAARADRQGPHRLARDEGLVRAHDGTVSRPGKLSPGEVTA